MNNKWTSMNKIAVRVSYGVYILALLFVVVMLFFDRYQFEPYAIGALVGLIPSTISHIMWAMYVEMSENIVHIASKTSYKSFDEAKQAGDIEWAGAAEFTGYSQVFIADNAEETDGSKCLLVKLNDTDAAKSLRDAAKLEGHPERIGMTVYVNGLKKANYGLPGIREIDAFKVEE